MKRGEMSEKYKLLYESMLQVSGVEITNVFAETYLYYVFCMYYHALNTVENI